VAKKTKWLFGVLITVLTVVVAFGAYLFISGSFKIGASGETESCLSVIQSRSTNNLTAEAGSFVNVAVGRKSTCGIPNAQSKFGLVEIADPTVASLETSIPTTAQTDAYYGTGFDKTGLYTRVRLLKPGSTTIAVKLVAGASATPLRYTVTATQPSSTSMFTDPDWVIVTGKPQGGEPKPSYINLSGGEGPYKYRTTKYETPTGIAQWESHTVDSPQFTANEDVADRAQVIVSGDQLKITGKENTVQVYGEVEDKNHNKVSTVRFIVYRNASITYDTGVVTAGEDIVKTVSDRAKMSLGGQRHLSLWKIESSDGTASTLHFRGLSSGLATEYIAGASVDPTATGAGYWNKVPLTRYTFTVNANDADSCLSVIPSRSTPNLTAETGSFLNVNVARQKYCGSVTSKFGLVEVEDPTVASLETAIPQTNAGVFGSNYDDTALYARIRLLKTGSTKVSVKLVDRADKNPYTFTITATQPSSTSVFSEPDWTMVPNQSTSVINLSGGAGSYKYRTTKYQTGLPSGEWSAFTELTGSFTTTEDSDRAKVEVVGNQLKITGKNQLVTVYGEVQDNAGKTIIVRYIAIPTAVVTAKTGKVEVGADSVQTVSDRTKMSLDGQGKVSLWKIESSNGTASTLYYRGLSQGSGSGFIGTTPTSTNGSAFWVNYPITTIGLTVSGTVTTASCSPEQVGLKFVPSAWNLMGMPTTKSNNTSLSKLLGVDDTNLNTWAYKGGGDPYQQTRTFSGGQGFWLNSSVDKLCMAKSDLTTKTSINLPYKGINIVTNPNADKAIQLKDINIKLGSGKEYALPDALKATETIGGKKYSVVKMIAFWTPESKANAKGNLNIYDIYVNKASYPNYRSDDYTIKVHDIAELPKTLGALQGVWVATRSNESVSVSYGK